MKIDNVKVGVEYALWPTTNPDARFFTPSRVRAEEVGVVAVPAYKGRGWLRTSALKDERRVRVVFADPAEAKKHHVHTDDKGQHWAPARYLHSTWEAYDAEVRAKAEAKATAARNTAEWSKAWAPVVPALGAVGVRVHGRANGCSEPLLPVTLPLEQAKTLIEVLTKEKA